MSDVFVSYKAEDRRRVQPLVHALQSDGLSVWWDEHIGTGDAWRETIERQLTEALCVVVMWSKRSVGPQGGFVREEAGRAQKRGVYVPVLIDAVDPPLGFGESQATSLKGWSGDRSDPRYRAVLAAIERNTGTKASARAAAAPTAARSGVSRRAVVGGSVAGAAAIAGAGGWFLLKPTAASANVNSVAVLPFANLSGDPNQAYFSDGIAEEIRSALSRLSGLEVVGRSSSEAVRDEDAQSAAKKLGVANILTGSVRQSSSTIRVNAELIDGSTGLDKWSQDYDRKPGDAIKIQTDIAENVASALSAALGGAVRQAIALGGTQNPAAQDLLLQTDPEHSDQSAEGVKSAISKLDQAISLDPAYAQAYARKARMLAFYGAVYADEGQSTIAAAEREAQKAIALAPGLSEAHSALAFVYRQQLRFKESLKEAQIAVSLPGANSGAKGNYAVTLAEAGYREEPLRIARDATTIDPLNPGAFGNEALILLWLRQFEAAAAAARHVLELNPAQVYWRGVLTYCLTLMHRYPEARAEAAKLAPDDVHRLYVEAIIASLTGDNSTSDELVDKLRAKYGDSASYQFAGIYAQRRDSDRAIAALRKAVEVRDPGLAAIQVDAFLDPIRGDPRLKDLIRSLDFPS